MSLKILHILGGQEDTGGIFSVIRNIQEVTREKGWEHVVWVSREFQQTRLPRLELRFAEVLVEDSLSHLQMLKQAWKAFGGLRRLLKTESFDLVHAHTRVAWLLAVALNRFCGYRVVYTNHNFARRTAMYRWATRWPNFYSVFLNPNMARHYGVTANRPQVSLISACFADRFLERALAREPRCLPVEEKVRIVGVGNLVRWKKWDLLADAILLLPSDLRWRLSVEIWGPESEEHDAQAFSKALKQKLAHPELKETMTLRGPTNQVEELVAGADIFVLPSTNEPCSVALMEALALGVPVLVSKSGGNIDIVEEGITGRLFEPDNADDLAAVLADLLAGKAFEFCPQTIRESVRGRSATAVAEAYEELYQTVLNGT